MSGNAYPEPTPKIPVSGAIERMARDAADPPPPDPDSSPFEEPSYETVEGTDKGLLGWIDRKVHGADPPPEEETQR